MWARIKAWCFNSTVMALAYVQFAVATVLINLDPIAAFLGAPDVSAQVAALAGPYAGQALRAIAILTAFARLRGIWARSA